MKFGGSSATNGTGSSKRRGRAGAEAALLPKRGRKAHAVLISARTRILASCCAALVSASRRPRAARARGTKIATGSAKKHRK